MTVFVPLSSLSAKILSKEYGLHQPISPSRSDWLMDILHIDRTGTRFRQEEEQVLTTGMLVNVPKPLALRVEGQGLGLGIVIHRLHLETISRHMWSCSKCYIPSSRESVGNGNAMAGLRYFYDHYGLDDSDFDQGSMYREHSRFSKKFLAKSAKKIAVDVRADSRIWRRPDNAVERINHDNLDRICALLDMRLASSRLRRLTVITKHAHMYIYAVRGGRDIAAIGRRFKLHNATVYRAIANVRVRIRKDERFRAAILPLLDPMFVLPPP